MRRSWLQGGSLGKSFAPCVFLEPSGGETYLQSEEHLVLEVPDSRLYPLGSVFYGIPVHICPTVALYDKAYVIRDREAIGEWPIIARSRRITY